jgi:hypothetical protein
MKKLLTLPSTIQHHLHPSPKNIFKTNKHSLQRPPHGTTHHQLDFRGKRFILQLAMQFTALLFACRGQHWIG